MAKYGMTPEGQSQTFEVTSSQEVALAVSNHGGSEGTSLLIMNPKLKGHNYLKWSQSVMMFICGKGKDEYLTDELIISEKNDSKFKVWKAENHMVMSWLINLLNHNIGENFILYKTAKEIWDATRMTYSSSENTIEFFKIEGKLHDLHLGDPTVSQYYNSLIHHWQQMDMFEVHTGKCPEDTSLYRKIVE